VDAYGHGDVEPGHLCGGVEALRLEGQGGACQDEAGVFARLVDVLLVRSLHLGWTNFSQVVMDRRRQLFDDV
jgi:hypothetical protein